MVNIEELKPRDIKKAKEIIRAFKLLGISSSDVARITDISKLAEENRNLKDRVEELENALATLNKTKQAEANSEAQKMMTPQDMLKEFASSVEEFNPYGIKQ